jgi:ribosomal protein L22
LTAAQRQLRSRAVLKNIRISPKKLARFAKLVSGMHVEDALAQCSVARETKAAALLRGVIASAAANARTNHGNLRGGGSDSDNANFRVAEAVVGRAPTPTRPWYHGKGRTGVRHLYRSHLTVRKLKNVYFRFFFFSLFSFFFAHLSVLFPL